MNNKEFAEQLANYHFTINPIAADQLKESISKFLQENNLQVINTKDQLLSFCSDDVVAWYLDSLEDYLKGYPNAPTKLTQEQSQHLLELANNLNSNHELGFCWDDIDEAIQQWLKENYDSKLD